MILATSRMTLIDQQLMNLRRTRPLPSKIRDLNLRLLIHSYQGISSQRPSFQQIKRPISLN